ncbi:MMPL family transporter [Deinococcus ruber]|uniref:Membrane protein n=1 Tax=Deinococcus ruber TaxID=1848197 RepID=A0A918C1F4_9DEIO|nr:MMPL family transporter [Deinococcus ruber]GGR02389.1 membrane protein [Deinococcus ruber]
MQPLARFVTSRPWLVLALWLALVLVCAPLAARAPAQLSADPGSLTHSESATVIELLKDRFGEGDTNTVLLLTQSEGKPDSPAFQTAYTTLLDGLRSVPGVGKVTPYSEQVGYPAVSPDGRLTLSLAQIPLRIPGTAALKRLRAYLDTWQTGAGKNAPFRVRVTGGQAIANDFTTYAESDTKRSEFAALPLTAIVLLLVFGALVATGLPLLMSVLSITVAMAGLYGLTQLTVISTFAQSVITLLGLGAGIDYALLMVNRFREELQRPLQPGGAQGAAYRTVLTAGRSVAFSGLTVAVAMAALIIPPLAFVRGMGFGGVLVVLLTVLVSITALPACFVLLGERVNSPRLLKLTWSQNARASEAWTAFARKVIARPWLGLVGCTVLLLALAAPALDLKTGYAGAFGLTAGVDSRDALRQVQALGAGGLLSNFEVVFDLKEQTYGPQSRDMLRRVSTELQALPGVQTVISPFLTASALRGGGSSLDSLGQLATLTRRSISADRHHLRLTIIPARYLRADQIDAYETRLRAVLDTAGVAYLVGGAPVGEREFTRAITSATPLAVGIVFGVTFLLFLVAFRSIVLPLKSILMNSLTVGAAYGVVVLVVQKGFLAGPLGIPDDVGVLDSSLPLLLFAVLFGLSMDYEIFLLSRVQEEHLRGASNDEAIVLAVGRTARIITSAAAIMFIVFCAFIVGRVVVNKSIGLGLAVAVLLDATLVRLILVPSFLKLAGKWNWWLPKWLDRLLPHVDIEH